MNQPTPHTVSTRLSARIRVMRIHGRTTDPALMEQALIAIHELQAALRETVTDLESWTNSEYSGTDELVPRLVKLQTYHRLFEE